MKLLQKDETKKFGNRCAQGYQKCDLLGKGGKAIVWLAQDLQSGEQVALKQFPKQNNEYDKSANNELAFQNALFPGILEADETEPVVPVNPFKYPGLSCISRLLTKIEEKEDLWLAYEQGSKTLSQRLCIIKAETNLNGERQYVVKHQSFYRVLL